MKTSIVEYNKFSDEYFITLPDDIVQSLQLAAGDTLEWFVENNKVYLTKKNPELS